MLFVMHLTRHVSFADDVTRHPFDNRFSYCQRVLELAPGCLGILTSEPTARHLLSLLFDVLHEW